MFTAVVHKDLARAEGYFSEHLAQNDYYAAGELRAGRWIGLAVERLRLSPVEVTREAFQALCENKNPETGERLTRRQEAEDKRRVFYDFTCSAPKSVSVMAVTLDDQRLVVAHEEAAREAFRELEAFAATRVRRHGQQRDRTTGNLVAAEFLHTSSRALDPLLHTHFTVFNGTFDEKETCWKALQASSMYEAIRYGTAVYRNELARRLQALGYAITHAEHGLEIAGVSQAILKRFSKRAQQRDEAVKELEQKLGRRLSNNEVAYAVHQTRSRKLTGISTAEVRERQLSQLQPEERQSLESLRASTSGRQVLPVPNAEHESLAFAVAHLFERKSVIPEHELLQTAITHTLGEVDVPKLKRAVRQSAELVATGRGLSTRTILETEWELIQTVNASCDSVAPLSPDYRPAEWLSEDQRRAILHLLNTGDRITGLRGLAGTGKTTALRELVAACQGAGVEPVFCAPTAAATNVLRKEGFNAVTLESLLLSKEPLSKHNVVVVDEAGAIGIDDLKRLFERAGDARIVLSGDTGQHASVTRGDALRILEEHSDLKSGQLTRIRRQRRADYRRAVELAAHKQTGEAFTRLERMGLVRELAGDRLHDSVAQAYLDALAQRQSALLVAPTWGEIETLTEKVRSRLKAARHLSGEEKEMEVFDSLSWTKAQKRDARQYRPGQVLLFHRAERGYRKGESAQVLRVTDDSLRLRRSDGSEAVFALKAGAAGFEVGELRKLPVAPGDKLLLQANAQRRFINGELVEVKAIQGDSLVLSDGRIIPPDYRTFTHGYAITSHAAQGKTVDEVLVVATSRSLPAVSQQQFYVSISRGRQACRIFTDDAELLRAHICRSSTRVAAVEAIPSVRMGPQNLLRRILAWAERVGELVRLNTALSTVSQRHFLKTTVRLHENNRTRISIG